MIRCDHRLAGGPLQCTNPQPHQAPGGCTYISTTGSHLDAEPAHTDRSRPT